MKKTLLSMILGASLIGASGCDIMRQGFTFDERRNFLVTLGLEAAKAMIHHELDPQQTNVTINNPPAPASDNSGENNSQKNPLLAHMGEIISCDKWEDSNKDNTIELDELTGIKDIFHQNEEIFLTVLLKEEPSLEGKNTWRVFNSQNKLIVSSNFIFSPYSSEYVCFNTSLKLDKVDNYIIEIYNPLNQKISSHGLKIIAKPSELEEKVEEVADENNQNDQKEDTPSNNQEYSQNKSTPSLPEHVTKDKDGIYYPEQGYQWVNPDDEEDFRVVKPEENAKNPSPLENKLKNKEKDDSPTTQEQEKDKSSNYILFVQDENHNKRVDDSEMEKAAKRINDLQDNLKISSFKTKDDLMCLFKFESNSNTQGEDVFIKIFDEEDNVISERKYINASEKFYEGNTSFSAPEKPGRYTVNLYDKNKKFIRSRTLIINE